MELRYLGYACINLSINATTNHTFRLARLSNEQIAQTAAQNLQSLREILAWNVEKNIRLFRVGSSIIPYASHISFSFDWVNAFQKELSEISAFVREHGLRLSMHPGQYTVLNATNPKIVSDSLRELEWQAELMRQLNPEQGNIVLHVGGAYGDKEASMRRFIENFTLLSLNAQSRLTLENDDVTYHAGEVLWLCKELQVPMIFDIFHHKCLHNTPHWQTGLAELLEEVISTWKGKVPKLHISSQRTGTRTSHADYITMEDFEELKYWMHQVGSGGFYDLMVEAKQKEQAVQQLLVERVRG